MNYYSQKQVIWHAPEFQAMGQPIILHAELITKYLMKSSGSDTRYH